MKEILKKIKTIILWPFRLIKKILLAGLIVLIIYTGFKLFDYHTNGNKIPQGSLCIPIVNELSKYDGKSYCLDSRSLDKSEYKFKQIYHSVLFLARSPIKSEGYTGHGWLIWFSFEQIDSSTIKIHEFLPAGYGGDPAKVTWSSKLIKFYENKIKGRIPTASRPFAEGLLSSFSMSPLKFEESTTKIPKGSPLNIPLNDLGSIFKTNNLGRAPDIISAIIIDPDDYQNSKEFYDEYAKDDYRLFFHDCTTLLLNMTTDFGMYRPPRILCAYPEETIEAIAKFNMIE